MATKDQLWAMIAEERLGLADLFDQLDEAQWGVESLCEGWTVRDIAAHLVGPFGKNLFQLTWKLASYRFDFNRFTLTEAKKDPRSGPEIAAVLRADKDYRWAPPGLGPIAPFTDAIVHGQDVRRPLGVSRALPADRSVTVLDFLASPKASRGFVQRGHLDGLTWRCTDVGWSSGQGPLVEGPAEAIVLSMLGRRVAYDDLDGDGVERLRAR